MCLMEVIVSDVRILRMGLKLMPQNFQGRHEEADTLIALHAKELCEKFAGKVIRHRCSYHTDCFGWPSIGSECYSVVWLCINC